MAVEAGKQVWWAKPISILIVARGEAPVDVFAFGFCLTFCESRAARPAQSTISWQPIAGGVPTNPVQRFQAAFSLLTFPIISESPFAYLPTSSTTGPPPSNA